MLVAAFSFSVLAIFLVVIRKIFFFSKSKNFDSLSKSELIDVAMKIKSKTTNYKDFNEMLCDYNLQNIKLIPACIEIIKTINDTLPLYIRPRSLKKRFFRKCALSKIEISTMEAAMDSECVEFEDFSEDFTVKFKTDDSFNGNLITLEEFNDSFKKNVQNKLDFMKLSKIHLRSMPNYLKQRLINMFNQMVWGEDSAKIKEHSIGISYLIYKEAKKGPLDDKSSYRTITTIPVVVNYFHRILSLRVSDYFLNQNKIIDTAVHKGSIPNIKYGVLEQIVKVKNVLRLSHENSTPAYLMFVDISNAFPSLNIKRLITLLRKYEVDDNILNYIETYYETLEYKVIVSRKTTCLKPWKQGLIQGCPLSPILFVVVMNYITGLLSDKYLEKYGYNLLGKPIMFTAFLDDICIIANSHEGLKLIFKEMKELFEMFNLNVNFDKTKVMAPVIPDEPMKNIEYVYMTTYLGEIIESDRLLKEAYKNVFKLLIRKLYRTHKATYSTEKKIEVFFEYILPWLQRKLLVSYDFTMEQKTNLRKITYYYLGKWGHTEKIAFQNPLSMILESSEDPYIKQILQDPIIVSMDEITNTIEEKGRKLSLKYKFRY